MSYRNWAIWFLAGLLIHVADFWLTVELLATQAFYEANPLLRWLFTDGHHIAVFAVKAFGWLLVMALAIYDQTSRWFTPAVVRYATLGFATIVGWNLGWYLTL